MKVTPEIIEQIRAEAEANGYTGALKKTTLGGRDYIYRSVSVREYDEIISMLENQEEIRNRDVTYMIVMRGVVWPELNLDIIPSLGMATPSVLREKIEIISGFVEDPIEHYYEDDLLVGFTAWENPDPEVVGDIVSVFEKNPFIQVRATSINTFPFIYRSITGGEYSQLIADSPEREELMKRVLQVGVVWPEEIPWDDIPAYIASSLQAKIYAASGMGGSEEEDEDLL